MGGRGCAVLCHWLDERQWKVCEEVHEMEGSVFVGSI